MTTMGTVQRALQVLFFCLSLYVLLVSASSIEETESVNKDDDYASESSTNDKFDSSSANGVRWMIEDERLNSTDMMEGYDSESIHDNVNLDSAEILEKKAAPLPPVLLEKQAGPRDNSEEYPSFMYMIFLLILFAVLFIYINLRRLGMACRPWGREGRMVRGTKRRIPTTEDDTKSKNVTVAVKFSSIF